MSYYQLVKKVPIAFLLRCMFSPRVSQSLSACVTRPGIGQRVQTCWRSITSLGSLRQQRFAHSLWPHGSLAVSHNSVQPSAVHVMPARSGLASSPTLRVLRPSAHHWSITAHMYSWCNCSVWRWMGHCTLHFTGIITLMSLPGLRGVDTVQYWPTECNMGHPFRVRRTIHLVRVKAI